MSKILSLLEKVFFLLMFASLTYCAILTIIAQTTVKLESIKGLATMIVIDVMWAFILIASGSLLADVLTTKK